MMNANDAPRLSENQQESHSSPPPTQFWASTLALCFCTLTHAYLLISVFPYSGYMVIDLLSSVNEENAGSYAGLLASSFMLGRAVSSYSWGKWADVYGRRTVLVASLSLSSLFSIFFGMSQTFTSAIVFRGLLGVSNGIVGTTKTLLSELAENNQDLETRGMALVVGMRGWGFLICPAIGGSLAEVVKQYPTAPWVTRFAPFFSKFPFLLPNIVGALFCITSLVMVKLCVKETLPEERLHPPTEIVSHCVVNCRRMLCIPHISQQEEKELIQETPLTIPNYSSTSLNNDDEQQHSNEGHPSSRHAQELKDNNNGHEHVEPASTSMATIWSRPDTRRHLLIYWVYSFVIISVDEAFPLFCISKQAGLSLSENSIGTILSISGLIFVLCQYICYTQLVNWLGIYASITVSVILTVPSIFLIPTSLLFPSSRDEPLSLVVTFYLSILMAIYRIVANIFFSSIAIATNRTVPASLRAATNGLGSLGASIGKGLGPAMCGVFVAYSFSSGVVPPRVGATVVFSVLSLGALLVAVPAATRLEPAQSSNRQRAYW